MNWSSYIYNGNFVFDLASELCLLYCSLNSLKIDKSSFEGVCSLNGAGCSNEDGRTETILDALLVAAGGLNLFVGVTETTDGCNDEFACGSFGAIDIDVVVCEFVGDWFDEDDDDDFTETTVFLLFSLFNDFDVIVADSP